MYEINDNYRYILGRDHRRLAWSAYESRRLVEWLEYPTKCPWLVRRHLGWLQSITIYRLGIDL